MKYQIQMENGENFMIKYTKTEAEAMIIELESIKHQIEYRIRQIQDNTERD